MNRAVFIIHRPAYYRLYTPLLEEALSRGLKVEVWHNYGHVRVGSKGYSFPELNLVPRIEGYGQVKKMCFSNTDELKKLIFGLNSSDILFDLRPPYFYWKEKTQELVCKWVTLQHGLDSFYELTDIDTGSLTPVVFAVFSQRWLEGGRQYLSKFSIRRDSALLDNFLIKVVGQPEFDGFKYVQDKGLIRKKYGIPEDKNVLLYLPFPYQNWNPGSAWEKAFAGLGMNTLLNKNELWDHQKKMPLFSKLTTDAKLMLSILKDPVAFSYWRRGVNEDRVFKALKIFAERNKLFLVVKPRLKFPVSEYIKENADLLVLDDETQNIPQKLKELLSIASLAVSYYSYSVLSAAFANVYHINITTPKEFFPDEKSKFFFSESSPSLFNYEGVSSCLSAQDVIAKMPQEDIKNFSVNSSARSSYIKEYIGFDDYNSSKRVFDLCLG